MKSFKIITEIERLHLNGVYTKEDYEEFTSDMVMEVYDSLPSEESIAENLNESLDQPYRRYSDDEIESFMTASLTEEEKIQYERDGFIDG